MFEEIPTKRPSTPLLDRINCPADLRDLKEHELPLLAHELRHFLLYTVGMTGGHFGAGLGVIELTIALHYVFDTPDDRLVWDVGHQAYPHKILTERRKLMHTLRQRGGIAPFPVRSESPYDAFGVGHSSTSVSAALGMAIASSMHDRNNRTIAIIGDAAMSAGLAFEALNHVADVEAKLLIILNDNAMSISQSVGGLAKYLARTIREDTRALPSKIPKGFDARRTHMNGTGTFFDELGFNYRGPVDGHDIKSLIHTLDDIKDLEGPQFLHIVTQKGKGFGPAEAAPVGSHSLSKIENIRAQKTVKLPTYSNVFGQWLVDMAELDPDLIGITPAMREGSDLIEFSERFPDRYFDVAIAEQHAVTLAAGLACGGLKPVVAIYSTFLQRAYDQVIHDVAIQNLNVLFAIDRAGLLEDGPTHAGSFDLSFLRCIPNMIIMAPSDENETRQMLFTGFQYPGPAAVRYPRGSGPGASVDKAMAALPLGKARVIRHGNDVAILAFGSMVAPSSGCAEVLDATLVDMRFVKPLDESLIEELAKSHRLIVTVEENVIIGGAGSGVNEVLSTLSINVSILNLGLPDAFVEQDKPARMLAECALTTEGITDSIVNRQALLGFSRTNTDVR